MKTFNDNAGKTWTLTINVDSIKRVRSLLNVNLLDIAEGKLLEQFIHDPILLCDTVYCVIKPEAEAKNVSDEEFGRSMAGDAIEHATTALLEELVDFFPLGKRRLLANALSKLKTLEAKALKVAQERLESPQLEQEMEAHLESLKGSGGSFGSLRESSESTPED